MKDLLANDRSDTKGKSAADADETISRLERELVLLKLKILPYVESLKN